MVRYLPGILKCLFLSEIALLRLAAGNGLESDCSNVSWCSCVVLGQLNNYSSLAFCIVESLYKSCVPFPFACWLIRAPKVHRCMEHGWDIPRDLCLDRSAWKAAIAVTRGSHWVSTIAYSNLLGTKTPCCSLELEFSVAYFQPASSVFLS
jgi:hypothetical protein